LRINVAINDNGNVMREAKRTTNVSTITGGIFQYICWQLQAVVERAYWQKISPKRGCLPAGNPTLIKQSGRQ